MPPIIVALIIAVTALAGGAAAQSALPPETRAELAAVTAQVVHTLSPGTAFSENRAEARETDQGSSHSTSKRTSSFSDIDSDDPITGTVPITGTHPVTDTEPITGTTPTPTPTATVPVTPSLPITDTIDEPDEGRGHGHRPPITGTIEVSLTATMSDVLNLQTDANVSGKSWEGLLAKLSAVRASLARGDANVARNQLDAFVNQLNAFRRSGHISSENYETLYSQYEALITSLKGTPRPEATPKAERGDDGGVVTDTISTETSDSDENSQSGEQERQGRVGRGKPMATPTPALANTGTEASTSTQEADDTDRDQGKNRQSTDDRRSTGDDHASTTTSNSGRSGTAPHSGGGKNRS